MNESVQHYLSEDSTAYFTFSFRPEGECINVYVLAHPGFNGQDPSPHKTHLFEDGKICFVAGREPRDMTQALALTKNWAEYFTEYRRTGAAQH